jgi:threonylcarbamoyladenosine tRNA methylthiotransferase MtaB
VQRFRELIESLARAKPGLAIGTDIIVGFPGETDERFDRTARLLRELPISYVHVFSFSPRPGTAAATMPDQVSPETKRRRSNRLIEIGAAKKRSFARDRIGTMEVVLIEGPARRISRFARCLTGSYCTVFVPHENAVPRSLARVRITHFSRGNLYGSIVDSCAESGASVGGGGG